MTDRVLLWEILMDQELSQYSAIIIDNNAETFSRYFFNCNIFIVLEDVILWSCFLFYFFYANQRLIDYLDEAIFTVLQVHLKEPEVIFLCSKLVSKRFISHANHLKKKWNDLVKIFLLDQEPVYNAFLVKLKLDFLNQPLPGREKSLWQLTLLRPLWL